MGGRRSILHEEQSVGRIPKRMQIWQREQREGWPTSIDHNGSTFGIDGSSNVSIDVRSSPAIVAAQGRGRASHSTADSSKKEECGFRLQHWHLQQFIATESPIPQAHILSRHSKLRNRTSFNTDKPLHKMTEQSTSFNTTSCFRKILLDHTAPYHKDCPYVSFDPMRRRGSTRQQSRQ